MHRSIVGTLVAVLGCVLVVSAMPAATADAAARAGGSGRVRVGSAGVFVTVPTGWKSIPQRTTLPSVEDPVTRIVAASGPIAFGRGCNELDYTFPSIAVAIVVVEWVRPTSAAKWHPRPRHFTERNLPVRAGQLECYAGRGGGGQFTDHGRRFAAYLLVGKRASATSIRGARAVLDTLVVRRGR